MKIEEKSTYTITLNKDEAKILRGIVMWCLGSNPAAWSVEGREILDKLKEELPS